jgi:hypothetical protein
MHGLCTPPQAAAFSGPWRKHLWTAEAPRPRPLHSQVHGGNICGPLVHPAPGRCILRSMEQTFVDRLCTPPQAAAFLDPWTKHLWTACAPRPRLLHSQVHGSNIRGPLVHLAPGRCILRSMEQTSVDRWSTPAPGCCILRSIEQTFVDRLCTTPQAAAFSGPWSKHLGTAGVLY